MTDSPPDSASDSALDTNLYNKTVPEIPIEIVSEEEMGLIEVALSLVATRSSPAAISAISSSSSRSSSSLFSSLSSSHFPKNVRSIQSITLVSKRRLSGSNLVADIEDSGGFRSIYTQKRVKVIETLLHRFRRKKGLSVTDLTATEWCEKQMEYCLVRGKPEITKAMKAGRDRHAKLEEEVVKKVKVRVESDEDIWALKFMNFIVGANQLLCEGLTRELPVIGFAEGVWMVGVIDEIRLPATDSDRNPTLVDTKTRVRDVLPTEPQRRNGRLQLMCYKYLWDNLVTDNFSSKQFFDFFSLNPHYILSQDIQENTAISGFPVKTLDDLVRYFKNTCCMLLPAHDKLLLRYEFQGDHSLLGEDKFAYDSDWLKSQIQGCLEFWLGEREAHYTPEEERWKCGYCKFASVCPTNTSPNSSPS